MPSPAPRPEPSTIRVRILDLRPEAGREYVISMPYSKKAAKQFIDGDVHIIGVEHFPELAPSEFVRLHDRLPTGDDYRMAFLARFGRRLDKRAPVQAEAPVEA